jgi:hypothetical protein
VSEDRDYAIIRGWWLDEGTQRSVMERVAPELLGSLGPDGEGIVEGEIVDEQEVACTATRLHVVAPDPVMILRSDIESVLREEEALHLHDILARLQKKHPRRYKHYDSVRLFGVEVRRRRIPVGDMRIPQCCQTRTSGICRIWLAEPDEAPG